MPSKSLVGTFTTEIKEIYFERSRLRKCPKEKLKYFKKFRSLKKNHGLMSSQVSKVQKNNEPPSRIFGNINDKIKMWKFLLPVS
ncbi:Uncharacterized protein FWK35_00012071 [Aphis craccivora]|uniref:Uncharacterized protein n=1 Tax=Aphis craccivora TaxID=307492 RepID=A0A6G0Y9Q4_APHCR|nr:Uncharacterized protein FWK35_00012071 [Aphis craccivora]